MPFTALKLLQEKNAALISCISYKLCSFCLSIYILGETHNGLCFPYIYQTKCLDLYGTVNTQNSATGERLILYMVK